MFKENRYICLQIIIYGMGFALIEAAARQNISRRATYAMRLTARCALLLASAVGLTVRRKPVCQSLNILSDNGLTYFVFVTVRFRVARSLVLIWTVRFFSNTSSVKIGRQPDTRMSDFQIRWRRILIRSKRSYWMLSVKCLTWIFSVKGHFRL